MQVLVVKHTGFQELRTAVPQLNRLQGRDQIWVKVAVREMI